MPLPVGTNVSDMWSFTILTVMTETHEISEMLVFSSTLTWLFTRDFISFIRRESFKPYIMYHLSYLALLCISFLAALACTHS
jgi:hypothetical protein